MTTPRQTPRRGGSCRQCHEPLVPGDLHARCVFCLGIDHATESLRHDDFCEACSLFSRSVLRARLRDAQADEAAAAGAPRPDDHNFAVPLPRDGGRGQARHALAPKCWPGVNLTTGVVPDRGRSVARRPPSPNPTSGSSRRHADERHGAGCGAPSTPAHAHEASQTYDTDDDEYDARYPLEFSDDEESPPPAAIRSVCSSRGPRGDDDTASIASSSAAKRDSAWAIFQQAADRLGVEIPENATAEPSPAATAMPGERVEPVRARPSYLLPTCPGLRDNLHLTWTAVPGQKHSKDPPEVAKFGNKMAEWSSLGLGKPPTIEPKLAKFLDGHFDPKVKKSPYHIVPGQQPTFHDKSTKKAVTQNAAVYERTSRIVAHLNGSALLLGSLSSLLGELTVSGDTSPSHQEICRITELLATLNRGTVQWAGAVLGSCVRQERDRWTDPVNLRSSVSDVNQQLRDLPITPDTLFPGGYEVVKAASDETTQVAEMVSTVGEKEQPPSPSPGPTPPKKDKRSTSAGGEKTTTTAATPPPPHPVQQHQGGRGGYGGRGGNRGKSDYGRSSYNRYGKGRGGQYRK